MLFKSTGIVNSFFKKNKKINIIIIIIIITNMELLTVGQVLHMKALFRDVNEVLQRSITVLRSKKMGILFPKWPGVTSTADKIKWTNHDKHLLGMALLVYAKASARSNSYVSTLRDKCWKWSWLFKHDRKSQDKELLRLLSVISLWFT